MAACDGCGFDPDALAVEQIGAGLRGAVPRLQELLAGDPAGLGQRPEPATWSALEYACHIRDVLFVQRDRVLRALVEECPDFPPMHREERVALARYASEPPGLVAQELAVGAGLLARLVDGLSPAQLARPCVYGYLGAGEVDLAWVGRHTVHEVEHHLHDIVRVLRAVGS